MTISKIEMNKTFFVVYDENNNILLSYGLSYRILCGFCDDFVLMIFKDKFCVYSEDGEYISRMEVAGRNFVRCSDHKFKLKNGVIIEVYDKYCNLLESYYDEEE